MCVFVGGGGGSVAMECVLIYFPSPQINPFFPRATGDAIRAVAREGSHLSKHQARAQLGWRLCQSVCDSSCLILPSCHNWVFPCHLFIQTLIKQHSLMPGLLKPWEYQYSDAGWNNLHPVSLAEFSHPVWSSVLDRRGDSEERVGNLQLKVTQQGHGRVGWTAIPCCRYSLWA